MASAKLSDLAQGALDALHQRESIQENVRTLKHSELRGQLALRLKAEGIKVPADADVTGDESIATVQIGEFEFRLVRTVGEIRWLFARWICRRCGQPHGGTTHTIMQKTDLGHVARDGLRAEEQCWGHS